MQQTYQEIYLSQEEDEGIWRTLRPKEISTNNSIELTNLEISFLGGVLNFNAAVQQQLAIHKLNMRESTEQISG
ncbi:hypothetical protein Tco_0273594 [Tanacetum coccineum]